MRKLPVTDGLDCLSSLYCLIPVQPISQSVLMTPCFGVVERCLFTSQLASTACRCYSDSCGVLLGTWRPGSLRCVSRTQCITSSYLRCSPWEMILVWGCCHWLHWSSDGIALDSLLAACDHDGSFRVHMSHLHDDSSCVHRRKPRRGRQGPPRSGGSSSPDIALG